MQYRANYAYAADQMPLVGNRNRSRLASGVSSESLRGGGSEKPRRRSHRPRGCRGGSNRRKNNNVEKNKRNNTSGPKNGNNENNRELCNKKMMPLTNRINTTKSIPKIDVKISSRHPPSIKTGDLDISRDDNLSFSLTTASDTDFASSSKDNSDSYHLNNDSYDFPSTQPTSSDSSSDPAIERRVLPFVQASPCFPNTCDGSHILPPLPFNAFDTEPIPSGPNPYALKLTSTQHHKKVGQESISVGSDPLASNGVASFPSQQNTIFHPTGPQNHNKHECSYRAERLAKQRQSVVGGSLFATSPRSFLMGLKK